MGKLDAFKGRITVIPGATSDREVIRQAVAGCDGVLTVLVPWGVQQYSTTTAQAVLDYARPGARLIFSCGWHITRDGKDVYALSLRVQMRVFPWLLRLTRVADINDQAAERPRRSRTPLPPHRDMIARVTPGAPPRLADLSRH